MMILNLKNFYCKVWRTNWKVITTRQIELILYGCSILEVVEIGQHFMTKDTAEFSQFTDAVACREYTLPSDEDTSEPKGWIRGNTKVGPVLEVTTCCLQSKYGVEIRIKSVNKDNSHFWIRISHGLHKLVTNLNNEQETSWSAVRRICAKIECKWYYKPIEGQSKTTKTIFWRLIHKNYTNWGENLDRYWTTRLFAHRLFSVEETDQSSSSWEPTSRQRWSDWILENKRSSSESFLLLSSLVWRKVEEKHGKSRRKQEKISVLFCCFRNNSIPPSSFRSLRTQSYWSFITGQCLDSGRFLQVH